LAAQPHGVFDGSLAVADAAEAPEQVRTARDRGELEHRRRLTLGVFPDLKATYCSLLCLCSAEDTGGYAAIADDFILVF
jgi:hypothetical protein